MNLKEIARVGLKGRKKDTSILKIVITLAFIFIITSTIFQGSIETTRLEQGLDLYGEWHGAYLQGDDEVLNRLKSEKDIDNIGISTIIGESENAGVLGTFDEELLDMGRFKLYKGRYPEAANEIMVELNQMSEMGLDLEVGQTIDIDFLVVEKKWDLTEYVESLMGEFDEEWERDYNQNNIADTGLAPPFGYTSLKDNTYHAVPFEKIGNILVLVSEDHVYVSPRHSYISPEMIIEEGAMYSHKLRMKKEFVVTGILQTYTDKWDSEGFKQANSFITEESGQEIIDVIYNNNLGDFSHHTIKHNMYLSSNSLKGDLYSNLKDNYPDMEIEDAPNEETLWMVRTFIQNLGKTKEELQQIFASMTYFDMQASGDNYIEGVGLDNKKMEINTSNFRKNRLSYPDRTGSTEYVLTYTIIAIIFLATTLAIFQIFLTQMRRRTRKIVLLKSIGATNFQIIKIIAYEGLYLLRTGFVIGVPTGFVISALLIYSMNIFGGRNIQFHVVPSLLLLGIAAGCLALFIGIAVPALYAVRTPLVGTMDKPPKHKKVRKKRDSNTITIKRQTFESINIRYYRLNMGKTLISYGLSLITIVILVTTILLCYISFDNYRDIVLANNRPDYAMETYFGEMKTKLPKIEEELLNLDGIEKAEAYKVGSSLLFWYDGIKSDKLLKEFERVLPNNLVGRHFTSYNDKLVDEEIWVKNSFQTKYYGIDSEGEMFNRYKSQITVGNIDKQKFNKGEEVILLVPMYLEKDNKLSDIKYSNEQILTSTTDDSRMAWLVKNSGAYTLSYSNKYANYYMKPEGIKAGDKIYLSADEEKIEGDSRVISFLSKEVIVGGIIHYFPEQGVWPFSNTISPYVVIGSYEGMESMYPNSKLGLLNKTLSEMKTIVNTLYPKTYGRTIWYIDTDSRIEDFVLDSKLLAYANSNGYTVYNYKASNAELYHEALNNAIIIGLLGITAATIACVILYNTTVSKLEQEKNRIGILQAFGVSKEQFSTQYLKLGVVTGITSIIISHIMLFAVLLLTSINLVEGINMGFADYIYDIFLNRLWLYPWFVHIIICVLYFIITVLIYYLPNKKVTNLYPVENIRSLNR